LTQTHDFLWANTDVSIWSTVEPGMGITAASMATMRPLFMAFFSRSKLFGYTTNGQTRSWKASRLGYFRKKETSDVEELELHSDLGKGIRVTTTVTNTQSTRTNRDQDIGTKSGRQKSDSEENLRAGSPCGVEFATDSSEDVGHRTIVEAGVTSPSRSAKTPDPSLFPARSP
jgi:hypothetical protein